MYLISCFRLLLVSSLLLTGQLPTLSNIYNIYIYVCVYVCVCVCVCVGRVAQSV